MLQNLLISASQLGVLWELVASYYTISRRCYSAL